MKILISNLRLNHYAGSEIWTFQVVQELIRQGHEVEIYTKEKGDVFDRLMLLGAKQITSTHFDLAILNHTPCIDELSRMNLTINKTIQTCHGVFPVPEQPFNKPFINQYFSVSQEIQNHLQTFDIESTLAVNPCNLRRYKRTKPINEHVKKVLICCVGQQAQTTASQACKQLGLQYEVHSKWHNPIFFFENKINEFDLVIGYGRGIIEAICCGRNVITYDSRRYTPTQGDGLITKENFNHALSCNFSGRALRKGFNVALLMNEIQDATKKNADWLYSQRKWFDVERIIKKYLDEKK